MRLWARVFAIGLCLGGWAAASGNERAAKAFPEAEGFGAYSLGGRGEGNRTPRVYIVDTLEDVVASDGKISLREAVRATGPRFVLFSVEGVIALKTPLVIINPYITIAGQSSPGGNITLANHGIYVQQGAHDVVIRYLRVRPLAVDDDFTSSTYGIRLYGSDQANFVDKVIIDHCSLSWALAGNFGVWKWVGNFTVQNSFLIEGARYGHEKGPHSKAIHVGGRETTNGSFHHNLIAHNSDRSPKLSSGNMYDFRNNIVYNWIRANAGNIIDVMRVNFVNNFYIDGNDVTDEPGNMWMVQLPKDGNYPKIYFSGNVGPLGVVENDWDAGIRHHRQPELYKLDEPVPMPLVGTDSVRDALNEVLDNAGANYLIRDLVDERIVTEIRYVLETYSDGSLNVAVPNGVSRTDVNVGRLGPSFGVLTAVLNLKMDRSHPDYMICIPRSRRIRAGQTREQVKEALLDAMVARRKISEAHKRRILADRSGTYRWEVVERIIPDLSTVLATTPITASAPKPDADADGLPDEWEQAHGLDANNPSDAVLDSDGDGYLNIEEYINTLAR